MKKYLMSDICTTVTDYVSNGSFASLKDNVQYSSSVDYARLIRLVDYNNKFSTTDAIYVNQKSYDFLKKSSLFGGEIIISNVGINLGTCFLAPNLMIPMTLGPNAIMIKTNQNDKYIYYYLTSEIGQEKLKSLTSGSAIPKFNKTDFKKLEITIHEPIEQQHIVNILGSIDEKIENNENIIKKINEITSALYMRECNISKFNAKLGNYIINFDKMRKPLSSRERESLDKFFPYYGATGIFDYVDDYIFDGDYILMGEDGTVADNEGFPIIQHVNCKFWVNNHTHILQATNGLDNNLLELILKLTKVKSIVTGAVQPKINQLNMNALSITIPTNYSKLQNEIKPLFYKRSNLQLKNKKMNKLKQFYLKKFFG